MRLWQMLKLILSKEKSGKNILQIEMKKSNNNNKKEIEIYERKIIKCFNN